jgi:hypothetical protein
MPERTAEELRNEIADERLGLHEDFDQLKAELRSRVPFLIAGVLAVALLAAALFTGIRRIRKLF